MSQFIGRAVAYIIAVAIAFTLILSFLPRVIVELQWIIIAAAVVAIIYMVLKYRGKSRSQSGVYCAHCGHIVHGMQQCVRCNCAHS